MNAKMRALLDEMPPGFDPTEPVEDLAALYREAYALKIPVP